MEYNEFIHNILMKDYKTLDRTMCNLATISPRGSRYKVRTSVGDVIFCIK